MENNNNRKRMTKRQQELLLERLNSNCDMVRGNRASPAIREQWSALATQLNLLGCSRDVKEWQSAWTLWANKVKTRARKVRDGVTGTGGGPAGPVLSDQDERVLDTIGRASIYGFGELESSLDPIDVLRPASVAPSEPTRSMPEEQAAVADEVDQQPQAAAAAEAVPSGAGRRAVPRLCRGQPNSHALLMVQSLNENSRLMRETLQEIAAELTAAIRANTVALEACTCRQTVQRTD